MRQPRLLESDDLWTSLRRLARGTSGRRLVAVPFVGQGGSRLLSLRRGDALLCALTKAHCRSGSVCPAELRILRRRGVKLYQQPNLHAKVFLFGRLAIVGSPNLSLNSRDGLDEAAALVTDSRFVRGVRQWFKGRLTEGISPGWLRECERAYRPPHTARRREGRKDQRVFVGRRVWIVGVKMMDFPEDEASAYRAGESAARRRLSREQGADIESIRWTRADGFPQRMEEGDLMIQVFDDGNGTRRRVHPAGKLLTIKRTRSSRGAVVHYTYLELPRRYRTLPWPGFKRQCRSFGLHLRKNVYQREIRDRVMTTRLLELTAPERLRRK